MMILYIKKDNKIRSGYILWLKTFITLLNFVICVPFVAASKRLGSNVNSNHDGALQFNVDVGPPNDDCEGAIIIPPSFPGTSYTTDGVSLKNATRSPGGSQNGCRLRLSKDVWYQFTPALTGFYDFSINFDNANIAVLADGGFAGATCNDAVLHNCPRFNPQIRQLPLNANTIYYIYVQPGLVTVNGPLELTVLRHMSPFNNQCTNATVLDTRLPQTVLTDSTQHAFHDKTADLLCNTDRVAETFWYKFTNPYPYPISLVTTIGDVATVGIVKIAVFRGINCSSLQCIGGKGGEYTVTYDFVADGLSSYYILLQVGTTIPVPFAATIQVSRRFFSLIDSRTDIAFQQLRDINYELLPTSSINLNLRANFASSPGTIQSARMTFDNPKRNFCERFTPFSVFGDTKGNFKNATIPLGRHTVTATPFRQANCTGTAGATLTQTFNVTGCVTYYYLAYFNGKRNTFIFLDPNAAVLPITLLPCAVNIYAFWICSFPINTIGVELRNSTSNELIQDVTQESPTETMPVTLFDISPTGTFLTGRIAKGSYTITTTIDNVTHRSATFMVVNTTCGI